MKQKKRRVLPFMAAPFSNSLKFVYLFRLHASAELIAPKV